MSRYSGHEHVVIHPVEELGQVYIHHYSPSFDDVFRRLLYRLMRVPPASKSVARLRKGRLHYPFQHLEYRLLYQSVYDCGYTQPSLPATRFVYLFAKYRLRLVAPIHQRFN
jgi:hypothetical protein